ncbi:MAG: polysaccharide biosynthesis C-terminal domain-containing protein [Prevotellaceae bacterium]|jgi:O-antigen/teichoic acid export membrane protein|nr:polysaccharide biosynthesis C-terminal domain-containing protein [Prevotellaceae bacterium]
MAQQQMKSLAKDTAIYGLSSIIGKFLNWLLVPLYTYVLASSADYGVVTNLYSWTALMLVILTYGMETGFFRFANSADEHADTVYGTSMTAVGATSIIFTLLLFVFAQPVANFLGYAANPEYIYLLGAAVAVDAFASIPFAWLRYKKRPVKFAVYKLLFVFFNIFFNLFFLIACPYLMEHAPSAVDWFYDPNYGVGYVIVANIISTVLQTLFLIPHIIEVKFSFDGALLKKILRYSLPLLVLGIAGIMNQTLDKILFPFIKADGVADLGIYGATSKMALIMLMFTQAFRYAYEPFVFAQQKSKDSTLQYALAMKYFVIVSWLIFLGMVFYLDIFKYLIRNDYWQGLQVVPIVLLSFIFQGIYFNLSIWYKLVDKTMYGAWFSILGTVVILVGNFALVPLYSYWGCAWAAFACYLVMMLVSYFVGQKYMPIAYDLRRMGIYTVSALGLYALSFLVDNDNVILFYGYRTMLFLVFVCIMIKLDLKRLITARR